MTIPFTISARVAAAVAGLGLVVSSIAPMAMAQTTTTTTTTTTTASFTRDLTIGSTGADVTALQNWLIAKGHTIAAGATGYFGAQTKAALAAYQAANGITPASGYFGPITRAKVAAPISVVTPAPSEDNEGEEGEEVSKEDARKALQSVKEAYEDTRDELADTDAKREDREDADDYLDEADELIDRADDSYREGDYQSSVSFSNQAGDLIEEALDALGERSSDEDDLEVETSADVNEVSGADNDIATFRIEFEINAFNTDAYLDEDADTSANFEIIDRNGDEVSGATSLSSLLRSSARESGGYYVLEEDESEVFTLTVTFDPEAADEGQHYALRLNGINYATSASSPSRVWNARPVSEYETDYVYIAD